MNWNMIKRDTTPAVLGIAMILNFILSVAIAANMGAVLQKQGQTSILAVITGTVVFIMITTIIFWISSLILDDSRQKDKCKEQCSSNPQMEYDMQAEQSLFEEGNIQQKHNMQADYKKQEEYKSSGASVWKKVVLEKGIREQADIMQYGELEILTGSRQGRCYLVPVKDKIVIGSDSRVSNLVFDSQMVDKKHCSIWYDPVMKMYVIQDDSAQGVYLDDGSRIPNRCRVCLEPGSVLQIGYSDNFLRLA